MWMLFGATVFHRSIVKWSGKYIHAQYMCILLYMKVIWCNGIPYIYGELEWGIHVSSVYVHFLYVRLISCNCIHRCIVNWSGSYIYPQYMCIMLYVKLMLCNSISYMYGQFDWGWGTCILSIYVFCYMWNLFGVTVFHRSNVNWSEGFMYPQCMCILLYVKLIWFNSIP